MPQVNKPVVFYVKCSPQNADAWPIARDHRIVFVGYPPFKDYDSFKSARTGFKQALYDVAKDPHCARQVKDIGRGARAAITRNATMAALVSPGSFVIVPRPKYGVCYIGDVTESFDVVDEPAWADEYLELRRKQGLPIDPVGDHVADVVQCWTIGTWTECSFGIIPRWITYRLLSRDTSGIIYNLPDLGLLVHPTLSSLHRSTVTPFQSTTDLALVAQRLVHFVAPSAFEHLIVHLLQLESASTIRWHHIGGSGDGGVDGIGMLPDGTVIEIVQCKWHYGGDLNRLATEALQVRNRWPNSAVVIAVLLGANVQPTSIVDGVRFLLLDDIAVLVKKHWQRLPIAQSLGIIGSAGHTVHRE